MAAHLGSRGQGESLIKLLVVAIIAIIALALAKSYFREASRTTQKTVSEVYKLSVVLPSVLLPGGLPDGPASRSVLGPES